MKIVWAPEALDDLAGALTYIAERNRPAAERLVLGITSLIERLAGDPLDGSEHVLRDGSRVRGWPYPPFRIDYQRTAEAFVVVRVYHQRRAPVAR